MSRAEDRHNDIANLASGASVRMLVMGEFLSIAYADRDYEELGMDNWALYLDSVGVSKSQDSKSRKAYSIFGENLRQLGCPLEVAYLAARIAKRDNLDYEEAKALTACPAFELVGMLRGEDPEPKETHLCPECGTEHILGRSQ